MQEHEPNTMERWDQQHRRQSGAKLYREEVSCHKVIVAPNRTCSARLLADCLRRKCI